MKNRLLFSVIFALTFSLLVTNISSSQGPVLTNPGKKSAFFTQNAQHPTALERLQLAGQFGGQPGPIVIQETLVYMGVGPKVFILDVSDPSRPTLMGQSAALPGFPSSIHIAGDYAFVTTGETGLQVMDVLDPTAPAIIGAYDTPGSAEDIIVIDDLAYIADGRAGLRIIDVSDPTKPEGISAFDTPGLAQSVYVSGLYAYLADSAAGLQIIDISDADTPLLEGALATPQPALNIQIIDGLAYVAAGNAGLLIVDVSDPADPERIERL